MKLLITPYKTRKSKIFFLKNKKYTFILNKDINKIKVKEYLYKNYLIKVSKINKIKIKKKIKIIVTLKSPVKNKLLINYENKKNKKEK